MFLKNKLVVLLLFAVLLTAFSYWRYTYRKQTYTQDQLFTWIETGYSQHFCNVVFPNFASCVTASVLQCPQLVHEALEPCVANLKIGLSATIKKQDVEELYARVGECFEMNIHSNIVNQFLVKSQECIDMMS